VPRAERHIVKVRLGSADLLFRLTFVGRFRIQWPGNRRCLSALIFLASAKALFFSEHFVAYRSLQTRIGWVPLAAMTCAALSSILSAGCQSSGQYDQVARELRMQEDELYALEDYLDQYQKLVCKYRSENAALKRQLAENGATPSKTRPSNGSRRAPTGPSINVPPADGTPPSEVESPEIPPLEETTSNDSNSTARGRRLRGRVKLAGGQIADGEVVHAQAIAFEPVASAPAVSDVWLHGEVVANQTGGGPRMLVKVEPLDAEGRPIAFSGPLSLMLMGPVEGGVQVPVARWDYRPQDVRAALSADGDGKTIQFHLELPPDTPTSDGTQLWVRLLQRQGAKLLAHADIKLQEPGLFSSRSEVRSDHAAGSPLDADTAPMVATAGEDGGAMPTGTASASSEVFDGGWTIARPGQPGGITKDGEAEKNDWRATLEQPPSVAASSAAAKPKPRVSRPRERTAPRNVAKAEPANRSAWSPERSAGAPRDVSRTATRPTWSATR
jgi:hypothetical protein